ncbi:hypothetical protein GCM10017691_47500 [Pseudonocardia petroleophila]
MAVLGWVMGLGTLWIVCACTVGLVLGGVILRSGVVRVVPVSRRPVPPAAADLVPSPRTPSLPRREPRLGSPASTVRRAADAPGRRKSHSG